MNKMFEDFFSNQWNIYGLQILCGSLMVIVLHNYLSIMGMCAMGLCVYLIAICQRMLGVRFGMLYYDFHKRRMVNLMNKLDEVKDNKDNQDKKRYRIKTKRRKKK